MLMENIALIWPKKLQKWHYVADAPTRAITVRFEFVKLRYLFRSRNNALWTNPLQYLIEVTNWNLKYRKYTGNFDKFSVKVLAVVSWSKAAPTGRVNLSLLNAERPFMPRQLTKLYFFSLRSFILEFFALQPKNPNYSRLLWPPWG